MAVSDIETLMLPGHPEPFSHYCHGVRAGDRLWISGTVGMTADGHVPDDVVEQFRIAMENLDGVLRAAGGAPENIVKVQARELGMQVVLVEHDPDDDDGLYNSSSWVLVTDNEFAATLARTVALLSTIVTAAPSRSSLINAEARFGYAKRYSVP